MAVKESDLIFRYTDVFNEEECKALCNYIDGLDEKSFLADNRKHLSSWEHKSFNIAHNYHMSAASWLGEKILPRMEPCVNHYLEMFSVLGKSSFRCHDLKIKKIDPGAGFHSWHFENGSVTSSGRLFVIQAFLNTIEEGGETEFLYQNRREKAIAGDVLMFPASYTHTHRGNTPINQTKYIATSWGWVQTIKDY